MKSYLNVNDIMKINSVSRSKAYKILRTLRAEKQDGVAFQDTYESKLIGKAVIPSKIYLNFFPHASGSIRALGD